MAVAVKNEVEAPAATPTMGLAGISLAGTLFLLLGFVVVYHLVPWVWAEHLAAAVGQDPSRFFGRGISFALAVLAAVVLVLLWHRTLGPQKVPGKRAGVFMGIVYTLVGLLLLDWSLLFVQWLIRWLDPQLVSEHGLIIGGIVTAVFVFFFGRFVIRRYQSEKFHNRLRLMEDHGWFAMRTYKKGQGLRLRRGTMLGILVLIGAGLWVFTGGPTAGWYSFVVPFSHRVELVDGVPIRTWAELPLLRSPGLTVPVVLGVLSIWLAYRLTNYPKFADFLIATEAEMNKVSWASWKKLRADTIVVLVMVVLLAVFLRVIDIIFVQVFSWIGVIQIK